MQNTFRWLLFATAILLANRVSVAVAGYLQAFLGNSDAESTAGAEAIDNYAVLSNTGSTGDTFGTGYSGFDGLALEDTTAKYLYLYDATSINAEFIEAVISDNGLPLGITSTVQVDLAFADNNGAVSTTNAFGSDSLIFQDNGPANLGVTSPHLVSESGLVSGSLSDTGTIFTDSYSENAGDTLELFGFTSNYPPAIVPAGPASQNYAGYAYPAPVPEPATLTLVGSALLGLGAVYLRRGRAKA